MSTLGAVSILDVGQYFACATTGSGLSCWGLNDSGQLGIGSMAASASTPTSLSGLPSGAVIDLALGATHACAIVERTLYCWGGNDSGQLGLGDTTGRRSPAAVTLPGTPVQIDAFGSTTCALLEDHTLACFGDNGSGQVGDPGLTDATVLSPHLVPGLNDVVQVAAGTTHTCAIRSGGTVWCWGNDGLGQIGDGGALGAPDVTAATETSSFPEAVIQIAAGSAHTCARTASAVYCWGDNGYTQCGQGVSAIAVFTPTAVPTLGAVEEVAVGTNHTCVRATSTDYYCFGSNNVGQLGDGTMTDHATPVLVTP